MTIAVEQKHARALASMRRSAHAALVKEYLEVKLARRRQAYEQSGAVLSGVFTTITSEVIADLFDNPVILG